MVEIDVKKVKIGTQIQCPLIQSLRIVPFSNVCSEVMKKTATILQIITKIIFNFIFTAFFSKLTRLEVVLKWWLTIDTCKLVISKSDDNATKKHLKKVFFPFKSRSQKTRSQNKQLIDDEFDQRKQRNVCNSFILCFKQNTLKNTYTQIRLVLHYFTRFDFGRFRMINSSDNFLCIWLTTLLRVFYARFGNS